MDNNELEQHINLDEQDKETEPKNDNNRDNVNCEIEESDEDMDNEEFNIEKEFQNQIDRSLEIDDNTDDDVNNIDIEDVEHPAQNKDAKWKLDTIFKDNLHCPF
ncbi:unnamed protein product [Rhizophagus irregularis]|uniref:Uncharacterized protein n=1 Tax=Rhizophagus irregularis TaxID=588596 RepID=A0A2N1M9U3_9GLOM|nr:hypothetical protein RhiirC2_796365 [Rhizophagus irregularis]CAB4386897.1 unnamed protein product [Rhizophagus irregularis]CAB5368148.1 unnamed protein product [Rhizophagus irregularis]